MDLALLIGVVLIAILTIAYGLRAHRVLELRILPVFYIFAIMSTLFFGVIRYADVSRSFLDSVLMSLTGGLIVLFILFNVASYEWSARHRMLHNVLRLIRRAGP